MTTRKVTENVWWTQYGDYDKPSLVVMSGATETEVEFCKAVEAFGIWKVIWENNYAEKLRKGEKLCSSAGS